MSQDPNQQRNLLLAVVLSMAVLLGWQVFYAGPTMKQEQARQQAQQELAKETTTPAKDGVSAAAGSDAEGTVPAAARCPPPQ
jgi:YidC/Oxa1 family membrane protein insertase